MSLPKTRRKRRGVSSPSHPLLHFHSLAAGHINKALSGLIRFSVFCLFLTASAALLKANVPAAIVSSTYPAVTLSSNGSTATMSNGIVSIVCQLSDAYLTAINYTYNNGNGTTTTQMLNGGTDGGQFYIGTDEYGGFAGSAPTYSVVANPSTTGSNYAEISLVSTSSTSGTVDIHFSMLRGSPGFYVTASWMHRSTDGPQSLGETRTNIYAGSIFNWMSVDPGRNKLMAVSPSNTSIPVPGAPVECYLWTSGIYQGLYDDKYKYSADFSDQQFGSAPGGPHRVWGWSSVGTSGLNVGMWDINASQEYYNGGPMKRELMCHIGTTILNMFNGDHYAEGMDTTFANGEVWNKVYGPYFVYCNNVSASMTDPYQASQALYNDALAQGAAEASGTPSAAGAAVGATAWPYGWFNYNTAYGMYVPASSRGTVTGQIVVSDTGNPNASGSNMFVGVVQQAPTSVGNYDFQYTTKPYEFWVQADWNGNFTIPNVIAGATGTNYTLYAFGPGAEGEFMSQAQTGGNPPITYNLPATQFSVPVAGGSTTNLGVVTWTPTRVGATVFEIGYPDRSARKFRHGDDYWVGDIGPSPTSPAAVWTKFLEYPFDFPNGMNYTVGSSRWTTDWDFVQPVVTNTVGDYVDSTGTLTFNLASAPAAGAVGSIYLGLCSNYGDATIVSVNSNNLGSTSGVTSTPNANASTGYYSPYGQSDTTIREGINGLFADERLTFPGTLLKQGANTITISLRQTGGGNSTAGYFADHIMYDYFRLELSGYVPPAPAGVNAYAGNNSMLLSWPATPGATSYNIARSITSGSNYSTVATGVVGPVCGSGFNNTTWLDSTASNGVTYYYEVQSVNTTGASAFSAQSAGVAPSAGGPTAPPAAATGLTATPSNGQVSLSWTASPNANYYIVERSVLVNNGGALAGTLANSAEAYNTLGTITLTNTTTGTNYIDSTINNGTTYAYSVIPVNAAGTGSAATSANAVPLAAAPTTAPTLSATPGSGQVTLNWTAVPNATGYVLGVGSSGSGPFTLLTSVTELAYVDTGLANGTTYYFIVQATNSGGTSAQSNVASAATAPPPPGSLTANPGNTQITLTWPTVSGATSYAVQRGTVTGGPYSLIGSTAGASFTDQNLTNGTPYYYVVASSNAGGTGSNSVQATAAPSASLCVAPTQLTATATNGEIVLAWNASAGATSYQLYRSTSNGGSYQSYGRTVTTTTESDNDVLGGITYYYVVAAIDSAGTGAYSNQASANLSGVASLIWTGASSSTWDTVTQNWVTSTGSAATYSDGANVIFSDSANTGTVSLPTGVSPGTVNFANSALDYNFNSSGTGILGTVAINKSGGATVTLTGPESYTGGTTISSGTYALGADSSESASTVESPGLTGGTNASLGSISSPVVVNTGGELRFGGVGGATVYTFIIPYPVTVNGGSINGADGLQEFTGGLTIGNAGANILPTWSGKSVEINSALSGSGNLTIDDWEASGDTAGGAVLVASASNSYSGTITINAPSTGYLGGVLEITNATALINATIIDNNTTNNGLTYSTTAPQIGALAGPGGISLRRTGGGGGGSSVTLTTGLNGGSTTYSGVLSNSGGLTKAGAGTMIISGSNTYTGATNVTGGILEILGAIADSSSANVSSGAVLYIAGGTLHINGSITNNGIVQLSGAATLTLTGTFTNNGVLDLINGPQTLPTNFVNNGTVLNSGSVQVQQIAMNGSSFSLTIQGYPDHMYQLQNTTSLVAPITWNNIGAAQTGTGGAITFTDPAASGTNGFYKILISP